MPELAEDSRALSLPVPSADQAVMMSEKVLRVYQQIAGERFKDIPLSHPGLSVKVIGGRPLSTSSKADQPPHDWVGVVITPLSMNLMLLPLPQEGEEETREENIFNPTYAGYCRLSLRFGDTTKVSFPAGEIDMMMGEEAALGRFLYTSLFSPMSNFADMATACTTAETVMAELFQYPAPMASTATASPKNSDNNPDKSPANSSTTFQAKTGKKMSRRDLFAGWRGEAQKSGSHPSERGTTGVKAEN